MSWHGWVDDGCGLGMGTNSKEMLGSNENLHLDNKYDINTSFKECEVNEHDWIC